MTPSCGAGRSGRTSVATTTEGGRTAGGRTAEVRRLANAPQGYPYRLEVRGDLTIEDANKQAQLWWESGGTLAIVVTVNGREDSRYEREYADASRVPKGWELRKTRVRDRADSAKLDPPRQLATVEPMPESVAPTVFNEPKAQPQSAWTEGACWVCKQPKQLWPGDVDRTPSGRLNERRCMECGAPLKLTHRQISQ